VEYQREPCESLGIISMLLQRAELLKIVFWYLLTLAICDAAVGACGIPVLLQTGSHAVSQLTVSDVFVKE